MKLVLIHGDPATGKYTVGRELAALTGWRLYHNHLVVDEVLRHHAFGTPGFVAERDRAWRSAFEEMAADGRQDIIFTFNPENTVPQDFIDWFFQDLPRRNVAIFSIGLSASEGTIEARLDTGQRRGFRKLTDVPLYRRLRAAGSFQLPVIPRSDLWIDTDQVSATEAARLIARLVQP